jgi:phytoene desaturase
MKTTVIIGAGLGGLAAGLRLAHAGHRVTVLEKNGTVGGKLNFWSEGGYSFDTGPTLLTMPFVVKDLFTSLGRNIEDYLTLIPVDPICRYRFADGTVLDASADLSATASAIGKLNEQDGRAFVRFLSHGGRIYRHATKPFLFTPFGSPGAGGFLRNLKYLPAIFNIDPLRTYNRAVTSYFQDERVVQMMNRFATYNGSSPYKAPATLAIIPYVEFSMGGWYVAGGMYGLARAMERLAAELGMEIRTKTEVTRVEIRRGTAVAVHCAGGESFPADVVISNADVLHSFGTIFRDNAVAGRFGRVEPSLAGFVMMLGVEADYPALAHHNIFFSADYREEFRQLFDLGLPATDPTVYVAASCKSDPRHAPPGHSNLFVLVNAPPLNDRVDWEERRESYADLVLRRLEDAGLAGLRQAVRVRSIVTPRDFAERYNAYRGSIYGTSSNGMAAAFLRPSNRLKEFDNVYFVGGSSHPGGGIPLVLLSGATVAGMVEARAA